MLALFAKFMQIRITWKKEEEEGITLKRKTDLGPCELYVRHLGFIEIFEYESKKINISLMAALLIKFILCFRILLRTFDYNVEGVFVARC